MKKLLMGLGAVAALAGGIAAAQAADVNQHTLVVTASNGVKNELLVYSSAATLLRTIPTQGQGGVGGNAGGVTYRDGRLAVVNFGSGTVSIFATDTAHANLTLTQVIPAGSSPVSVAFSDDHLYILGTTQVESHAFDQTGISASADGVAALVRADGSAAQVGVLDAQLVISEKNNAIETVSLDRHGAVAGAATLVGNIPANVNAPFGLATRGNNAYVTIAHADEISLVRNQEVLTVTPSVSQHAPCWVALDGPFLFSANSPSKSVSRYAVYGEKVVQDAAVIAEFNGNPTDIAAHGGLAAVVDNNGSVAHVSVFKVDEDGNFTLRGVAPVNGANGIAIIAQPDPEQ